MADEESKYTTPVNEDQLNSLFKEILDGCRDDILEAQTNMETYLEEVIKSADMKAIYGPLFNDALKIKGQARDRQLKFLGMFKDRVTTKEKIEIETGKTNPKGTSNLDPSEIIRLVEEQTKAKTQARVEMTGNLPEETRPSEPKAIKEKVAEMQKKQIKPLPDVEYESEEDEGLEDYELVDTTEENELNEFEEEWGIDDDYEENADDDE